MTRARSCRTATTSSGVELATPERTITIPSDVQVEAETEAAGRTAHAER